MEKEVKSSFRNLCYITAIIFAIELIGGIIALIYLNNYYSGVMSNGFLITLPLFGFILCFAHKRTSQVRMNFFYGLQLFIFLLVPVLLWIFFPKVSYEEAKMMVQKENSYIIETQKQTFSLEDSGNPFIRKSYYFLVNENGKQIEYIVNPVKGKVSRLPN